MFEKCIASEPAAFSSIDTNLLDMFERSVPSDIASMKYVTVGHLRTTVEYKPLHLPDDLKDMSRRILSLCTFMINNHTNGDSLLKTNDVTYEQKLDNLVKSFVKYRKEHRGPFFSVMYFLSQRMLKHVKLNSSQRKALQW